MSAPDPKPRPRIRATSGQWRAIRARKLVGRPCRICQAAPATNLHHIIPRSLGGDDCEDAVVELCGSGASGCHGLVEARDVTARSRLRERLTVDELAYVLDRKGAAWLESNYGPPTRIVESSHERDSTPPLHGEDSRR